MVELWTIVKMISSDLGRLAILANRYGYRQ
jgi:hypothetical protein